MTATILVCTRCNWTGSDVERAGQRSGATLLDLVQIAAMDTVTVQAVACLSGCRHACAVGMMGPGKVGYLFGDLPPTPEAVAEITAFAALYESWPDGWVRRAERPPLLRESILARLPPLEWARDGEIVWPIHASGPA